jgi:multidrug efflux pump subunit AcrB
VLPAVFIAVYQTPGSNALEVDREVRSRMGELARRFPTGIEWDIKYDTTTFVSASMHDVVITLGEALALVIAVVFLFLQSWRSTVIPAIAIPVSLIATLAVMLALGFSLNTVSMLGMVLAIGLVVDDAIVVVENVERQLEQGLSPIAAAVAAMREVTGPIIATTAVLLAVFVPVAFLPGVTGRLHNQFALTIAISVAISAFNSLTLSPALCAVLLRHRPPSRWSAFRAFNAGFTFAAHAYANGIRRVIGARWAALALFAAGLVLTYGIYSRIPAGFLPVEDQGYLFRDPASGRCLAATDRGCRREGSDNPGGAGRCDGCDPGHRHEFPDRANQSNSAVEFALLKPWAERGATLTASNILTAVRPKLLAIPDAVALSFDPPSIPGIATTGGFEFQVEDLTGQGAQALNDATQALLAEARKQPELNAPPIQHVQHLDTGIQLRS